MHVRLKARVTECLTDYFARGGAEEYQSGLFKPVRGYHVYKDVWDPYTWVTASPRSTRETTRTISTLWQSYQWTATARSFVYGE